MDIMKNFESLSESERVRFLHLLESGSKGSFNYQNETPEASSSEGSNLRDFLKNLKNVLDEKYPVSNFNQENSKKKQKTLDGWLIKRDNGSSPKNKAEHASSKGAVQPSVTSHSCNEAEVSSHSEHTPADSGEDQSSLSSVSSGSKIVYENGRIVKKPDMHIHVRIRNIQADTCRGVERTKLDNEKYNLRRSERKACELSPDSLGNRLTVENGNSNMDSSSVKKNSNQRTKKKNSKLLQSVKTNNSITVQTDSNREVVHTAINRNEPSLNISSSSNCNYEAFCLLSNECSKAGINVMEILQHEKIQTLLRDKESLSDDAIVFIGSCETETKNIKPVVHVAKSKKILHEKLMELRK